MKVIVHLYKRGDKMDKSLSVIITAYNCERYIQRCIQSVVNQTYNNYEIIIVDDGSIDETGNICDEYAELYKNIKVVHKQNGGTVSARKEGIIESCGAMVCFIDGDDWIDNTYFERAMKLYQRNLDIEIISFGLIFEYVEAPQKNHQLEDAASGGFYDKIRVYKDILPYYIYDYRKNQSAITTSVCCKFVKKELAKEAIEMLDKRITYGEDGAFVLALLLKTKSLYVCKEAGYHYEQHQNSQNFNFDENALYNLVLLKDCMYTIGKEADDAMIIREQIDYYIKSYLVEWGNRVLKVDIANRIYAFPTSRIKKKSKIVVHGAGKVGKQYIHFLRSCCEYDLVAWTDKNSEEQFVESYKPCSMDELEKLDFDYVILAAADSKMRKQMKEEIQTHYISENKIVDCNPIIYRV